MRLRPTLDAMARHAQTGSTGKKIRLVYPRMNDKITIRRLLAITAVSSVCFCALAIPRPVYTTTVIDASPPDTIVVEPQLTTFQSLHVFLHSWPIQFLAYMGSVMLVVHTIGLSFGLNGPALWALAISIPCVAELMWYYFVIVREPLHRDTLGVWGHVWLGLILNTVAYAVFRAILVLLQRACGTRNQLLDRSFD